MIPTIGRPLEIKGPTVDETPDYLGYAILKDFFNVSYDEIWCVFDSKEASEYGRHLVLTDPAIAAYWLQS